MKIRGLISDTLRGRIWPYLLLAALVMLFLWDSLFAGKVLCMRDTFCDFVPWRTFSRQAVRAGVIPLWNHYSHSGQPFVAEPQTAFFYPLNVLFYVLPVTFALKLSFALHLFIAAASSYGLMRHWKVNAAGALLTAVSFTFSTYLIAQMEFLSVFNTIVWMPAVLLLSSVLISRWHNSEREKLVYKVGHILPVIAAMAAVLATQFLAGNIQPFFYSLLLAFAYLTVRCATLRSIKLLMNMVVIFGLAGFLALCLSMVQFLLTWELIPYSIRGENFDPELNMASVHPRMLISWFLPFFAGRPGYNDSWWGMNNDPQTNMTMFEFWLGTGYIGIAPLILVSMVLLHLWRRRQQITEPHRFLVVFFIAAALVGLIVAMGKYTPVYEFIYNRIPGFNRFRWPAKMLQIVVLATSILAGFGLHAITDSHQQPDLRRLNRYKIVWLVWLTVLIVMAAAYLAAGRSPNFYTWLTGGAFKHLPQRPQRLAGLVGDYKLAIIFFAASLVSIGIVLRNQKRPSAKAAAIILVAYANLFLIGRQVHFITDDKIYEERPQEILERIDYNEPVRIADNFEYSGQQMLYGVSDQKLYEFAKQVDIGETLLPYQVFKTRGGGALKMERYVELSDKLYILKPDDKRWQRAADLLNIRYLIYGPAMKDIVRGLEPAKYGTFENQTCLPRAMVVEHWNVIPDDNEAIGILISPYYEPRQSAIIDGLPTGQAIQIPSAPPAQKTFGSSYKDYGIDSICYDWNKVRIKANAKKQSLLVLNDTWYPGWKAFVDGKEQTIVRANAVFRGVFLEPGQHDILFVYEPWQFKAGAAISIGTLLILFISGYLGHRFTAAKSRIQEQLNEKSNLNKGFKRNNGV
jgi:hypothetical protein